MLGRGVGEDAAEREDEHDHAGREPPGERLLHRGDVAAPATALREPPWPPRCRGRPGVRAVPCEVRPGEREGGRRATGCRGGAARRVPGVPGRAAGPARACRQRRAIASGGDPVRARRSRARLRRARRRGRRARRAGARRGGGRAAAPEGARRLRHERGAAAREAGRPAAAPGRRAARRPAAAGRRRGRGRRRGAGLPQRAAAGDALGRVAVDVVAAGPAYGRGDAAAGQTVDLEFVSANPTGPMHIGGMRWAAVGDALGPAARGRRRRVTREYYVNDAGVQIDRFGAACSPPRPGEPVPEQGYARGVRRGVAKQVVAESPGLLDCRPNSDGRVPREGSACSSPRSRRSLARSASSSTRGPPSWRCTSPAPSSGRSRGCASRARLRVRRRGLAAHDRLRRRQGPGRWSRATASAATTLSDTAYYVDKRDARLRPLHLHARRRPPRLRRPAQGPGGLRRRRPGASLEVRSASGQVLRGGQPMRMSKRSRRHRDAGGPRRDGRRRRRALLAGPLPGRQRR